MVVDSRYRLISRIGSSSVASVYLADDVRLRRRVAVKLLAESVASEPAFLRRFGTELQAAAALRHPHIVVIHDWGMDDEVFVASEYLENGSLRQLIDQGVRLAPAQALQLGLAAARALSFAHERGVAHRGLRPSNLLFAADGRLRITDFGLARAFAEAASTEPIGVGGVGVRYASPEQARGRNIDGSADVYALALTLIEAVTGEVPFVADTALATLMARVEEPLVVPESLGPLQGPLARAGTRDPSERLDAAGLATALMAVAGELPEPEPLPFGAVPSGSDAPIQDLTYDDITLVVTPDELDRARVDAAASALPEVVVGELVGEVVADATVEPESASRSASDSQPFIDIGNEPGPEDTSGVEDRPAGSTDPAPVVAGAGLPTAAAAPASDGAGDGPDDDPGKDRRRRNQRRWRVAWFVLVAVLVVGGGVVGTIIWQAQQVPTHPIPSVNGLTEAQAAARLHRLGFDVATRHERRDGTKAGQLLGVDPTVGTKVAEGHIVTLVVSNGQTIVKIPDDVAGQEQEAAAKKLSGLGFKVAEPTQEYSESVADGVVIGLGSGTPSGLEKGSAVTLVVSKGPKPRVIPSVSGMTPEQASAALTKIGLVPNIVREGDTKVDTGGLIGLDPAPGASVPRGATVTVFESKGLLVAVPSLDGVTTVAGAIDKLQQAGLVPGTMKGSGQLSGHPVTYDPPAGKLVFKGSRVDIIVQ